MLHLTWTGPTLTPTPTPTPKHPQSPKQSLVKPHLWPGQCLFTEIQSTGDFATTDTLQQIELAINLVTRLHKRHSSQSICKVYNATGHQSQPSGDGNACLYLVTRARSVDHPGKCPRSTYLSQPYMNQGSCENQHRAYTIHSDPILPRKNHCSPAS